MRPAGRRQCLAWVAGARGGEEGEERLPTGRCKRHKCTLDAQRDRWGGSRGAAVRGRRRSRTPCAAPAALAGGGLGPKRSAALKGLGGWVQIVGLPADGRLTVVDRPAGTLAPIRGGAVQTGGRVTPPRRRRAWRAPPRGARQAAWAAARLEAGRGRGGGGGRGEGWGRGGAGRGGAGRGWAGWGESSPGSIEAGAPSGPGAPPRQPRPRQLRPGPALHAPPQTAAPSLTEAVLQPPQPHAQLLQQQQRRAPPRVLRVAALQHAADQGRQRARRRGPAAPRCVDLALPLHRALPALARGAAGGAAARRGLAALAALAPLGAGVRGRAVGGVQLQGLPVELLAQRRVALDVRRRAGGGLGRAAGGQRGGKLLGGGGRGREVEERPGFEGAEVRARGALQAPERPGPKETPARTCSAATVASPMSFSSPRAPSPSAAGGPASSTDPAPRGAPASAASAAEGLIMSHSERCTVWATWTTASTSAANEDLWRAGAGT
jgi:hypothetical protein